MDEQEKLNEISACPENAAGCCGETISDASESTSEPLNDGLPTESEERFEEALYNGPVVEGESEAPTSEKPPKEETFFVSEESESALTEAPTEQAQEVLEPSDAEPELSVPMVQEDDPLHDAHVLPSLFPEDDMLVEEEPQVETTVVSRPKKKKKSLLLRFFGSVVKWFIAAVLTLAILAVGMIGYLTMTEYSPGYAEKPKSGNERIATVYNGGELRIVTFNTGYAGLGEDADSFMDGGSGVKPESEELVVSNMIGIERILSGCDADVIFLQEVDTDSDRSFGMNQWLQYEYDLGEYESRFALNYSCEYVPYPIGDFLGKVNSGIATYSRYDITSATRYSLPCPFSWPVRVANLKRCLLVTRLPIQGRDQELVLVNFHLEAYDDGEGKAAQTEQLIELLKDEYEKGNYVIAGGDFNQIFPGSKAYPIKDDATWVPGKLDMLPYGWRYAYDESAPTCRLLNQPYDPRSEATQYYVIDGFIVSPNVTVKQVRTLNEEFVFSDHNPVVLDIELK